MGAAEVLAVLMVIAVCTLLFAGYPVALTLGGVSLAFAVIGQLAGVMSFGLLGALPQRIYRLESEQFEAVDEWLKPYRRLWARHLDALERHLDSLPGDSTNQDPPEEK